MRAPFRIPLGRIAIISSFLISGIAFAQTENPIPIPNLVQRFAMRAMPMAQISKSYLLPIGILPRGRCTFGDRDALFFELAQSKNRSIILTIERLDAPAIVEPLAYLDLTNNQIAGVKYQLKIPQDTPDTIAGIYLCRDATGAKRCIDKLSVKLDTVLSSYRPGKVNGPQPVDKVYFFQPVVISKGKLYFLKDRLLPRAQKLLSEEISIRSTQNHGREGSGAYFENLQANIASEPLTIEKEVLALVLPGYDKVRCTGGK